MDRQRIPHQVVGELRVHHDSQGSIRPAVLGMAFAAGQVGIGLAQHTVQWSGDQQLDSYISMTDNTPVGHAGCAPEGNMTQRALVGNFRMGADAAQRGAGLCIKSARAEKDAIIRDGKTGHDENCQNGTDDAGSGNKTQRGVLHT